MLYLALNIKRDEEKKCIRQRDQCYSEVYFITGTDRIGIEYIRGKIKVVIVVNTMRSYSSRGIDTRIIKRAESLRTGRVLSTNI